MKKITAALALAGAALSAHSEIVRIDIFANAAWYYDTIPVHVWMAIDRTREAEINANGGQTNGIDGGPGLASFDILGCGADWSAHTMGGLGYSPTGFAISVGGDGTNVRDCTLGIRATFTGDPHPYDGQALPGSSIEGGGFAGNGVLTMMELTGYVIRVSGNIVAASDPWLLPEPTTAVLLGAGLLGLIGTRRRQRLALDGASAP
ncbi:PEP-CTERM sorting domain-containing protein [Pseudorhodoferax sp.]|uniref:PEP-CTERM sorting domain-containing protein n=1 Tax=Pseudorhodoferax sp. TaxID=1993553 RepID=UPI0039E25759